jgi:hypothetical protein
LQELLSQFVSGRIELTLEDERVLASCWHDLKGGGEGGMEGYKLKNRMESVVWNPPFLEFDIERHGATVNGSIYAGVQHWSVNVAAGEASLVGEKRRAVHAKNKSLKTGPLADEISKAIVAHATDRRLKWEGDHKVRILIVSIIPTTNQQTTSGRRKRFWKALEEEVKPHGWIRVSPRSSFLKKQV